MHSTDTDGEVTDEDLVVLIKAGDQKSFETILKKYRGMLSTIIGRITHNDMDTEDVLSHLQLEVWTKISAYDQGKGKFLGWLITMARRRSIDFARRRAARERAMDRFELEPLNLWDGMSGGGDINIKMDTEECLSRIPIAQRAAVRGCLMEGMSQWEFAAKYDLPLGTVKTRIELGLKKLRDMWRDLNLERMPNPYLAVVSPLPKKDVLEPCPAPPPPIPVALLPKKVPMPILQISRAIPPRWMRQHTMRRRSLSGRYPIIPRDELPGVF